MKLTQLSGLMLLTPGALFAATFAAHTPAWAQMENTAATQQETGQAVQQDAKTAGMLKLARDFVSRVQAGYREADDYVKQYYALADLHEQDEFISIADGEVLLL